MRVCQEGRSGRGATDRAPPDALEPGAAGPGSGGGGHGIGRHQWPGPPVYVASERLDAALGVSFVRVEIGGRCMKMGIT